jgi:hypothetical protein
VLLLHDPLFLNPFLALLQRELESKELGNFNPVEICGLGEDARALENRDNIFMGRGVSRPVRSSRENLSRRPQIKCNVTSYVANQVMSLTG